MFDNLQTLHYILTFSNTFVQPDNIKAITCICMDYSKLINDKRTYLICCYEVDGHSYSNKQRFGNLIRTLYNKYREKKFAKK